VIDGAKQALEKPICCAESHRASTSTVQHARPQRFGISVGSGKQTGISLVLCLLYFL
jgi:hypothetical protein